MIFIKVLLTVALCVTVFYSVRFIRTMVQELLRNLTVAYRLYTARSATFITTLGLVLLSGAILLVCIHFLFQMAGILLIAIWVG